MLRQSIFATMLLVAIAVSAFAQNTPSADQIIELLKPQTRGIRPGPAPAADPAAVAPPVAPAGASATPPVTSPVATSPVATPPLVTQPVVAQPVIAPPVVVPVAPPSVDLTVQFQSGSATLTTQAMHTLDELGRALSSATLAAYRFRIEGHTDTVGAADMNKALSDRRARAVTIYLQDKFGVAAARLEPVGMGDTVLAVPTPPQTDEPRNRRVHVVNLGT